MRNAGILVFLLLSSISSFGQDFDNLMLGIRAKYNMVDYTLNDVIDFTGNPITIQFIVGGVNNAYRNNNLTALKYKLRK